MTMRLFAIILLIVPMFSSVKCLAGLRGQIVAIDNCVFVALVDPSVESCVYLQEKENWCWAACVQMILRYHYISKPQSEIVTQVYGYTYDWTASGNEIVTAFNNWNGFTVKSYKTKTAQSFIDEIASGHPLIIGYRGHAYLLTHIYYTKGSNGGLLPFKVIMINPATGREEVFDWSIIYGNLTTIVSFYR